MSRQLLFVVFFVYVGYAICAPSSKLTDEECSDRMDTLDENIRMILILFDPNRTTLNTMDELNDYCDDFDDRYRKVVTYRDCMKSFPRTIFGIAMRSLKKLKKDLCTESELARILDHLVCMDEETKPALMQINDQVTTVATYVSKLSNLDQIIPATCCAIKKLTKIAQGEIATICRGKSRRNDTGEFAVNLFMQALTDAMDLVCGKYPTIESCDQQEPETMKSLTEVIESPNSYNFTFIRPLVEIIKRLDETVNIQEESNNNGGGGGNK